MEYVWGAGDVAIEPPPVPIGLGIGPLTFPVILVPGRTRDDGGVELWYLRASELATPFRIDVVRFRYYSGAASLGGGAAMGIFRDDFASIDVQAEIDPLAVRPLLQAAFWDPSDDTLVITLSGTGGPLSGWGRFSTIKWSPGAGVVWKVVDHVLPAFHDGRGQITRVLGATWGLGGNFLLQTGSGDVLVNQAGANFKTLFWLDEQQAVLGQVGAGAGVREIAKRYLSRAAPNTLTVGQVVAALCQRAGLAAGDTNTSALTDSLRGYILPRPTSARDAITTARRRLPVRRRRAGRRAAVPQARWGRRRHHPLCRDGAGGPRRLGAAGAARPGCRPAARAHRALSRCRAGLRAERPVLAPANQPRPRQSAPTPPPASTCPSH